jgi:hypothetical protein
MYGLTIRFLADNSTLVRFDGIDASWTFTALKGPYGVLEKYDLFVGSKISLFGRHLTISSANGAACRWIRQEKTRLEKQQAEFRRRIESVGQTPCVRKREKETAQSIARTLKGDEYTNLRFLLKDSARLGEQLAKLGLASKVVK